MPGQQVQSATLDGADKRRRAPAAMAGGAGGAVGVPGLPPSSRVIGGWAPSQYLGRLANSAGVDPATIDRHGEWLASQPPSSPTQEAPFTVQPPSPRHRNGGSRLRCPLGWGTSGRV
jgi:hypothetical protein